MTTKLKRAWFCIFYNVSIPCNELCLRKKKCHHRSFQSCLPNKVYSRHYVKGYRIRRFYWYRGSVQYEICRPRAGCRQNKAEICTVHFLNSPACPPGKRSWNTLYRRVHPVVFDMRELGINIFFSKFSKLVNALQIKRMEKKR